MARYVLILNIFVFDVSWFIVVVSLGILCQILQFLFFHEQLTIPQQSLSVETLIFDVRAINVLFSSFFGKRDKSSSESRMHGEAENEAIVVFFYLRPQ
jgi:hypothetical protein